MRHLYPVPGLLTQVKDKPLSPCQVAQPGHRSRGGAGSGEAYRRDAIREAAGESEGAAGQGNPGDVPADAQNIKPKDVRQPTRARRRIRNLHTHACQSPWILRESLLLEPGGPFIDRKAVVDEERRPPRPIPQRGTLPHAGGAVGSPDRPGLRITHGDAP